MERMNPNKDLKTRCHISFWMADLNFGPECRYLIYMDLDENKTKMSYRWHEWAWF